MAMRIRMFLIVAAIAGLAISLIKGAFMTRVGRTGMRSSRDRAARCATPTAVTAWFAMTITAIASAPTPNINRVRGAAGDSGGESELMSTPFVRAGQTRAD